MVDSAMLTTRNVEGSAVSLAEVAPRGLERREVHGVGGPGAGGHGVHAADGAEEALLAHHRPQHRRDGLVRVLVARQRLHPRLQGNDTNCLRAFREVPTTNFHSQLFLKYEWNSVHCVM